MIGLIQMCAFPWQSSLAGCLSILLHVDHPSVALVTSHEVHERRREQVPKCHVIQLVKLFKHSGYYYTQSVYPVPVRMVPHVLMPFQAEPQAGHAPNAYLPIEYKENIALFAFSFIHPKSGASLHPQRAWPWFGGRIPC